MTRFVLDHRVELIDGGRGLLGGDPTRLLRLSAAGGRLVSTWLTRVVEIDASTSPAVVALVERLVDAGAAHPLPDPSRLPDLAVVIPVRDRPEALDRCLAALVAADVSDLVVVDDGSTDAATHALVAERHGAMLVRREHSGGPAAARMSGWHALTARHEPPQFMAFVDSDIEVTSEWWSALGGHFTTPEVGLVAPRVTHVDGDTLVDRYEAASSPLDLGPDPAAISAGTRVSYVPAAAIVVRAAAFAAIGGFDEALDVGEDVDLVWRLADAGWRCRYEPRSVVGHQGRSTLGPMLRRRVDYGRSAAKLDARHPGALPPLRGSCWSAGVTALAAAGHPVVATAVAIGNAEMLARKFGDLPQARRIALRLVFRGHVGFARQVARALVRPWLPITLAAALVSRRARRLALVGALVHPVLTWRSERPDVALPMWVALTLADDAAYAAGVWAGCVGDSHYGALAPNCQN